MALKTAAEIRAAEQIDASFVDAAIETARFLAENHISQCMAEDFAGSTDEPAVIAAHSALTAYYLFQNPVKIKAGGAVKTEQDTASALSNTMHNEYFAPKDLENITKGYFARAKMLLAPWCNLETDCGNCGKTTETKPVKYYRKFRAYKPTTPNC